ncbi:hypothetical protein OJ274_004766 [Salmonella enterica]|nr:hypothetical protein [Salmonella enterica]
MKLRETVNARLSEWRKGCRLIWHEWLILFLVICILVTAGGGWTNEYDPEAVFLLRGRKETGQRT